MPQQELQSSAKMRLFSPLSASVLATASAGCGIVVGLNSLFGETLIPGLFTIMLVSLAMLSASALLWYAAVRSTALPGSFRIDDENATRLYVSAVAFAVLLSLSLLPLSWLWWSRLLLIPSASAMLYYIGTAHRIPGREDWMAHVQSWSPPFAALLLAIAISAGCLTQEWAEIPLILLLLIDAGLSVARFQTSDQAIRDVRTAVTNPLRRSTNAAMLLRFFTGTILAALLLGMRPGFVPVAILGAYIIDRLLLQVSIAMVHYAEASA